MYWPRARMLRGSSVSSCGRMPPSGRAGCPAHPPLPAPPPGGRGGPAPPRRAGAVVGVWVPAREGLAVALLPPPRHAPAAEVRPDEVLEDVEDVRVLGDLEHP